MCFCASAAFQNLLFSLLAWFQILFMFYHEFFEWLFDMVWCIRTSVCSCFGWQQIFAFGFIQFEFRSFLRFRYLRLTRLEWTCQPRTRNCTRWSIPLPAAEAALLKRLHPWIRSSFLASVTIIIIITRQSHSILLPEQLELSRVCILSNLIILEWIKKMLGVWPSLINMGAISRRSVQIIKIWDFSFSIYELIVASLHSMIFEIIVNWRIMRIEHNLEHLINHISDVLFRPFVWLSKIWIRIYLYKPNPKVLINHKIVAKELKWLLAMMRVDLALNSQEGIDDDILHPGYQVFLNAHLNLWSTKSALSFLLEFFTIQIFLEVSIAQGISLFVLSISIFLLYLETLIRKMYCQIVIIQRILAARGSQISWPVEVQLILAGGYCPYSNIKLSILVQ